MANEHTEGYWTSLAIKEMRMKSTTRGPFTPTRMVIIKEAGGGGVLEKRTPFHIAGGNVKWSRHLGKQFVSSSIVKQRVNHENEPFHV